MTILSILCATTPDRHEMFTNLYNELQTQLTFMETFHASLGEIEILVDDSKRFLDGGLSIGKKREALVKRATGRYICFLDSDENIAPNYLETLVRLCQQDKDVCTFRSLARTDFYWSIIDMRLGSENEEATPDRIVKRNCWHICPIRTEYAQRYEFEDKNYAEDWDWMKQVLKDCKTEAHTDAILHEYRHSKLISEADKITRYEMANKSI